METDSSSESIFALANEDAEEAREWLSAGFIAQRSEGSAWALTPEQQAGIREVLSLEWWQSAVSDGADDGHASHGVLLGNLLPAAVRAASALPLGGVVLAMYLRNLVNEAWELNWDHSLIRAAVNAAVDEARSLAPEGADAVAWSLLRFMNHEFDVEAALLTGDLRAVIRITAEATASIAPIRRSARALPAHPGRRRLIEETRCEHRYYRAIHEIAVATAGLLSRRIDDVSVDIARITTLIDRGGFRAVDASELRGHLASLEAVHRASERPWLHIDEGRMRIIYGFGVLRQGADELSADLDAVRRLADAAEQSERLGPLRLTKVLRRLTLSDVWQGSDSLGRRYRGSTLQLEDVVLAAAGADTDSLTIRTQVQLSDLGNHAVLFDIDLANAPAVEVARIVNLATPVFGDLTEIPQALHLHPRSEPRTRLSRLADVVAAVLDDLRALLRDAGEAEHGAAGDSADPISARSGSFGVVVTVERASRDVGGVRTPLTSAREIPGLWGAQPLLHPLPAGASGVADWAMYDIDDVDTFELLHLNDELLAANSNVTLLASFRSPDYAVSEIESFITFAHSMHGMYEAWQSRVREHAESISGLLTDVESLLAAADASSSGGDVAAQQEVTDRLGDLVRVIERAELELQSFVQSKQAIMLFVESPAIVSSPALRMDLDTVLRSNRYHLLRQGFERAVRDVLGSRLQPLLDVCHRRIERILDDRQSERERRTERVERVLGVILAVIGISGMASLLQEGFGLRGDITWWFIVAILVVAAAIGVVMIVMSRRAGGRRRRSGSPR
ncbi:hypothetical protein Q9R19_05325 [Microbacterium sp. ARD32]|uniref:hypothetical protein n=1 Tax=Microbacterium sp. ARD32 TaxID=2962577 RepID=UPI0028828E86|nr:hypothetical protein [Microbacterium sp. ARD32]MDT0157044.1 hypothetical protein [Microbacterium sp. ARD32]